MKSALLTLATFACIGGAAWTGNLLANLGLRRGWPFERQLVVVACLALAWGFVTLWLLTALVGKP